MLRYRSTNPKVKLSLPPDFVTTGVVYVYLTDEVTDDVLKSTNGGMSFDKTASSPFEASPEANEKAKQHAAKSASTLYLGGDKGHVAVTIDGGNSWTLLAKDFGNAID